MQPLTLPPSLDADSALAFACNLREWDAVPEFVVDFSALENVEPFGLLCAAAALKALFKRRNYQGVAGAVGLRNGHPAHEYLAQVGLLKWLGIPSGVAAGTPPKVAIWLPLTVLTRDELRTRMLERGTGLGAVIQIESERLARLLTQRHDLKINAPLAYCFREVIRNVFEHAATDRCTVCAQRHRDGTTELAIIDQGRGIRASLAERFVLHDDLAALRHALRPGISRNLSADPQDVWGNSGFGLFVLSELGRELGSFIAASGASALVLRAGREDAISTDCAGTAIQIRLKPPKGINFSEHIDAVVVRGELASVPSTRRPASASTRMIR